MISLIKIGIDNFTQPEYLYENGLLGWNHYFFGQYQHARQLGFFPVEMGRKVHAWVTEQFPLPHWIECEFFNDEDDDEAITIDGFDEMHGDQPFVGLIILWRGDKSRREKRKLDNFFVHYKLRWHDER